MSRGCSVISSIRTVGRLAFSRCQLLPRSSDTNRPGLGAEVEHVRILQILGQRARDLALEVRRRSTATSGRSRCSRKCRSRNRSGGGRRTSRRRSLRRTATARPPTRRCPSARPAILSMTFVHVLPPSRVTARLPSSVPAYRTPARFGDSANETIVGHAGMPSFFAMLISLPLTPIVDDVVAVLVGRQIRARRRSTTAVVRRAEHLVGGGVEDLRIVRRMHERRVPVPAQRRLARSGHGPDRHRLDGHAIDADHVAVLRLAVGDAVVGRILQDDEAVAALQRRPVVVGDAGRAAHLARPAPAVVVLHAAADVVRRRHVVAHVVEEPDRKIGQEVPRLRHVVRHGQAAVVADEDVVRVRRVDPDRVVIRVRPRRGGGIDGLAAVERLVEIDAAEVHDLGIVRIDPHLAEVHRPRVRVVHLAPRRAGVVRAIEAGRRGVQRAAAAAATAAWLPVPPPAPRPDLLRGRGAAPATAAAASRAGPSMSA